MVEIVLAIGILAFGFASVLGMFPVAIKAVRNSQAESAAIDAVSDIHAYFSSLARVPMINYKAADATQKRAILADGYVYAALFNSSGLTNPSQVQNMYESYYDMNFYEVGGSGTGDIESFRTVIKNNSDSSVMYNGSYFLAQLKEKLASINRNTDDIQEELRKSNLKYVKNINLFQPANAHNSNYVYFYLVNADEEFYNINFTAQILIWTSKMDRIYQFNDNAYDPDATTYQQAVVLNFEVSWPINVPYDQREKRYYQTIITNPQ